MWSEEEMREIEPVPPAWRTASKGLAGVVRAAVAQGNLARRAGYAHELTRGAVPSVVYAPGADGTHGNFIAGSYRRILANAGWRARLGKAHTGKRQARAMGAEEEVRAWCELDTATSSDALLMNVFCYPRALSAAKLPALLGVENGCVPEFGYRPRLALERGLEDRTEIDMRLGRLLVEAKLTESDFQYAPLRLMERYPGFGETFEREALTVSRRGLHGYQLLRGVLAAEAEQGLFCVLVDARRTDLIEEWYAVMRAVRSLRVQARLRLVTWQEVAGAVPGALRRFLAEKYGIAATG